jgi:quercetin dioxygenase-like cupin family protein
MPPSQPFIVQEAQVEVEGWDDAARGAVTWRTLISGDRTPTDSLTQGVAELREGDPQARRLHRHAHAETYYVLSGRGWLRVGDDDHALAPGVAAFIPGNALHGARAEGPDPLRILYTFAADAFSEVEYEFPDTAI